MLLLISKRYMYLIIDLTPFRLSRLNVRYKEYFGYFLPSLSSFLFKVNIYWRWRDGMRWMSLVLYTMQHPQLRRACLLQMRITDLLSADLYYLFLKQNFFSAKWWKFHWISRMLLLRFIITTCRRVVFNDI